MSWSKSFGVTVAAASLVGLSQHEDIRYKYWERSCSEETKRAVKATKLIERWMQVSGTPGVSVGVSVDGKLVYSKGLGLADVENTFRCQPNSVMRIASISKAITATITAKLFENGAIDLDKSIYEYVSDFPTKKWEGKEVDITIRQLLGHRGGIRHYNNNPSGEIDPKIVEEIYASYNEKGPEKKLEHLLRKRFEKTSEALELFKDDALAKKLGEFNYTTHGYTLLAACLEKASGKTFQKLTSEFFTDLGMNNTYLDVNDKIIPNRARYYRRNRKHELVNVPEVDSSYKYAGGGILSTTQDLLKFANVMLASSQGVPNSYLSQDTVRKFVNETYKTDDYKHFYALGWSNTSQEKTIAGTKQHQTGYFYHTGAATGCSSLMLVKPFHSKTTKASIDHPKGVCVVILANCQEVYAEITDIGEQLISIFSYEPKDL